MPAKWLERADEPEVEPDTESHYLCQNARKWPESPMDPAIRAVLHLKPTYAFTGLDIIADRRTLAAILEMAVTKVGKNNNNGSKRDIISFVAQIIGKTVVLARTDASSPQIITRFAGSLSTSRSSTSNTPMT